MADRFLKCISGLVCDWLIAGTALGDFIKSHLQDVPAFGAAAVFAGDAVTLQCQKGHCGIKQVFKHPADSGEQTDKKQNSGSQIIGKRNLSRSVNRHGDNSLCYYITAYHNATIYAIKRSEKSRQNKVSVLFALYFDGVRFSSG